MESFDFDGTEVQLQLDNEVFQPTSLTHLLIEQMGDVNGKDVLDIGCGTGPVAITTALRGAKHVSAVDIMEKAPELVKKNAALNGVANKVKAYSGNLFEPLPEVTFDVIIDDVSGMAEKVARLTSWYPESIPTGGEDGADPTVGMLHSAKKYLKPNGRLLFPVISLANEKRMLSVAKEEFGDRVKEVKSKLFPFSEELKEHLDTLNELKEEGIIDFIQHRSRYLWRLKIYEVDLSK